jgi:hypothetical protein
MVRMFSLEHPPGMVRQTEIGNGTRVDCIILMRHPRHFLPQLVPQRQRRLKTPSFACYSPLYFGQVASMGWLSLSRPEPLEICSLPLGCVVA